MKELRVPRGLQTFLVVAVVLLLERILFYAMALLIG